MSNENAPLSDELILGMTEFNKTEEEEIELVVTEDSEESEEYVSGPDSVPRMTERECLWFGKYDAEKRNHILGVEYKKLEVQALKLQLRVYELELEIAKRDTFSTISSVQEDKKKLVELASAMEPKYNEFVEELASKHDLDPRKMSFDVDTGLLKDLRDLE